MKPTPDLYSPENPSIYQEEQLLKVYDDLLDIYYGENHKILDKKNITILLDCVSGIIEINTERMRDER